MSWDYKKNIASPLIVNLLSALIIFLVAILLKDHIHRWLKSQPEVPEFPLFCLAEAYQSEDGKFGDFFIINLNDDTYSYGDLKAFLQLNISDQDAPKVPNIKIRWDSDFGEDKISKISEDENFNKGKGRIEIDPPDNKGRREEWTIKVLEIKPKAILRLKILMTEYERGVRRGAKASRPFEYSYPREPKF